MLPHLLVFLAVYFLGWLVLLDVTVDISLDLDLSDLVLCVLLDQRLVLSGGHVFEHLLSLSRGKG